MNKTHLIVFTLFYLSTYNINAQKNIQFNDSFQYYYIKWSKNIKLDSNDFKANKTKGRKTEVTLNGYIFIKDGYIGYYTKTENRNISETIDDELKKKLDSIYRFTSKYNDSVFILNCIKKSHYKNGRDSSFLEGINIYADFRLLNEIQKLESAYYLPIDSSNNNESVSSEDDSSLIDNNFGSFDIERDVIKINDSTFHYNIFTIFLPFESVFDSKGILNLLYQQNCFDLYEVYTRKFRKSVIQCLRSKKPINYERTIDSLNNEYKIVNSCINECLKYEKDNYNRKIPYSSKLKKEQLWSEKIKKELESLKEYENPEGTIIVKKRK